jgi:hypothetical protein
MQPLLTNNLEQVAHILKAHHVRRAYAFGSILTNRFDADSDVDLLITFKKIPFGEYTTNYWSLEEELEKLFQRKVDIVVEKNLTNPYLKKVITATRTVIYE